MTDHRDQGASLSCDTVRAFEATDYRVHAPEPFTLRIGEASEPLRALHERHDAGGSAFVTACNPMAQVLSAEENTERHARLGHLLRSEKRVCMAGVGKHPTNGWPGEPSWLIIGIDAGAAAELGRRFGQAAIVHSNRDAVPRLVMLVPVRDR